MNPQLENYDLSISNLTRAIMLLPANVRERYLELLLSFVESKGLTLTKERILREFQEHSMDYVREVNPNRFFQAPKSEGMWVDTSINYVVKQQEPFHNLFFAVFLGQLDLLSVDDFLDYHFKAYYKSNIILFEKYLRLTVRQYQPDIISFVHSITVKEWIDEQLVQSEKDSVKLKVKRTSKDNLTELNQEQTALLFHYMRNSGFILDDVVLNDSELSEAIAMLTGYSAKMMRVALGGDQLKKIMSRKNLDHLHNYVLRLLQKIKDALSNSRSHKPEIH